MDDSKKLKKNELMMEQGSFAQLLVKLSLPAVIVILIMIIYNMADTFFIGQTNEPNKISAISICMPVFAVLSGLGTLFGIGGGTAISIALGEKNYDRIKHISTFSCFGALLVGTAFTVFTLSFTGQICLFLGANEETLEAAITYLRIFAYAAPFIMFSGAYGNILRSDGEAALPMLANMSGTILNIILDALFIFVFKWDVFGAALATVIGNIFTVIMVLMILFRKKRIFIPDLRHMVLKREIVIPVLTLGLPMTFSTVLNSVSSVIQNRLMIQHGSISLAAQSVAGKFGMLITMLIMGVSMGIQPAISYNYGAKNYKRMDQVVKQTLIFNISLGIVMAAFIFLVKDQAIAVFINNDEVISMGRIFVLASVISGPIYAVSQMCQTFLQATGKASYAIIISLLDKGIIYIPVLFIMNHFFGAYGIAFSHCLTIVISVIFAITLSKTWANEIKVVK